MMVEAMEDLKEGVRVGGELLKDVRFADYQGIVGESGLQKIMGALSKTAKKVRHENKCQEDQSYESLQRRD